MGRGFKRVGRGTTRRRKPLTAQQIRERQLTGELRRCRHAWRVFVAAKDGLPWRYCVHCGRLESQSSVVSPGEP
jgi:hypothetical protein